MYMKEKVYEWIKLIVLILGVAVAGVILLYLVYKIPVEPMAEHVLASEQTLWEQNDENAKRMFFDWYDIGTNIIILHEVVYPSTGNVLADAMLAPTADYFGGDMTQWIHTLIDFAKAPIITQDNYKTYGRYWHGYLVLLKPLFCFFTLEQVYILNSVILTVILVVTTYMVYRRLGKYVIAYVFTIVLLNLHYIMRSFQLSSVFYGLNLTLLLLLIFFSEEKKKKMMYIFAIDGMWIAFFDFLTYPLVALSIPLLIFVLLNREDQIKDQIRYLIRNGIAFIIGYGGLWSLKWIFATVFTEENIIKDGIENILHRVGAVEMAGDIIFEDSPLSAIKVNITTFFNEQTVIIIGIFLLVYLVYCVRTKGRVSFHISIFLCCTVIGMSPILWYAIVHNHCSLHPHLEWREIVILFFAGAVMMLDLIENGDKNGDRNHRK